MPSALILDAVIIGGGAAGLWTLDRLVARGYQVVLLEAFELGSGQTIASQGILHGGLKYTLSGMLTPSAKAIREMPVIWRECLEGKREPKLTRTMVRSPHCYLWRTESVASRLGMIGARVGLRVAPQAIAKDDRPVALMNCPGTVAKIDEQVIEHVLAIQSVLLCMRSEGCKR
jgi:choline dehydrogenase-like flavoprotein